MASLASEESLTHDASPGRGSSPLWGRGSLLFGLVMIIVFADWLTPAGIVVGILLAVPILLSSAGDDRRTVILIGTAAVVGFLLAALFGEGPISPQAVWLPNRVFAIVAIVVSAVVSMRLQRRRLEAESARAEAESARDLNRLLHALMAHDLRSPLILARDALAAVDRPLRTGEPVDPMLITEVDARLRRSLRAIQLVLASARADLTPPGDEDPAPLIDVGHELRDEVAAFEQEAAARGKQLRLALPAEGPVARVDPSVVRQAVAILLDNAIRYAQSGDVLLTASTHHHELQVSVRDDGPDGGSRSRGSDSGEGLGLRLCMLLAQRAGGTLERAKADPAGTEFVLRFPVAS